jgi:hypothetical protein
VARFARSFGRTAWVLIAWLLAFAAGADEPSWYGGTFTLSSGFDWSTGDYDDPEDTDILYVPLTVGYRWERFPVTPYRLDELELRVTVPYLDVDGPGVLVDGVPVTDVAVVDRGGQRDGLGDVLIRTTYRIFPPPGSRLPLLELTARVKAPTADRSDGLGTGEVDTTLEIGLAQRFGMLSVFASAGYRFVGDPPRGHLDDTVLASVGGSLRLAERFGAGLAYDWRQSATPGSDDLHELLPYAWFDLGEHLRVGPYAVVGLSDGSPDIGAGLQLTVSVPFQ